MSFQVLDIFYLCLFYTFKGRGHLGKCEMVRTPPPPLCENFTNFPHDGEIKIIFTNLYSICFRPGTKFFIKNVAWKWRSDSRADLSETWSIRTTWNTFQWFISRGQMCRTISSGTSHICITTIKYLLIFHPCFHPLV